jgi:DNA-binding NarL/FixJ family response regulator
VGISVAVAGSPPCYRAGLELELAEAGFRVEHPHDAVAWATQDGQRALRHIRHSKDDLTVIALLGDLSESVYRAVLEVAVYPAPWDSPPDVIIRCLEGALRGEVFLPMSIAHSLAQTTPTPADSRFNEVQQTIAEAILRGETNRRIAQRLHVSERTVRRHLQDIYRKLGVTNRIEAAAVQFERSLDGNVQGIHPWPHGPLALALDGNPLGRGGQKS